MATPPIITPIPAPIIIVQQEHKTEAQILRENGGHMYFAVHLKHCAECRAEHEREKAFNEKMFYFFLFSVILIVATVAFFVCWVDVKEWVKEKWMRARMRSNPWCIFEKSSTRIDSLSDLRGVKAINFLPSPFYDYIEKGQIEVIKYNEVQSDLGESLRKKDYFVFVTKEASFLITNKTNGFWGRTTYGLRLPFSLHANLYKRLFGNE